MLKTQVLPTKTPSRLLLAMMLWATSYACSSFQLNTFDYEKAVDTTNRPIEKQDKRMFSIVASGVHADNMFDGARLNGFIRKPAFDTYQAIIKPENKPINPSPWYAFRVWADSRQAINLELKYSEGKHRYHPKMSRDGINWEPISAQKVLVAPDSSSASFVLDIGPDKVWIAGQELHNSAIVKKWCVGKSLNPHVQYLTLGRSKLSRTMIALDIGIGEEKNKDLIVLFARQHPTEITGYLALQAFVDALLEDSRLSNDFRRRYRVLVFPLLNPDGVDMGHWRHNAGGVDLNLDWAYYRQPEVRGIAEYLVQECIDKESQIILGIDFHSSFQDAFYTPDITTDSKLDGFKEYWLHAMEKSLEDYKAAERPQAASLPNSINWFHQQFGAEGITMEVGDNTPREIIEQKGKIAAVEMMQMLIFR